MSRPLLPLVSPLSLLFLFPILYTSHRLLFKKRKTDRNRRIPHTKERVIIFGSSSGIGRVIANKYAERGAYVCVVGRRENKVSEVVEECRMLVPMSEKSLDLKGKIQGFVGDIADVDVMDKLRDLIENEWNGVDTLIVAAGVSAVKPLLSIAYSQSQSPSSQANTVSSDSVQSAGVHRIVSAASAAVRGNYIGPLVAATTFIPLLSSTSPAPSIHLISSLASVIPAPTRSLYGSTKSASLILYQSLSIEHPNINWSYVLPSTVQGNFRAGAVDVFPGDDVPTTSAISLPATSNVTPGISPDRVADTSIRAIDTQDSRPIFMPSTMRYAHWLYWIWPGFVEERARRKYGFTT